MEKIVLVGFPNSGKSLLFNAICAQDTPVLPYEFSTKEQAVSFALYRDHRVDRLAELSQSKKKVYTGFQVIDCPLEATHGQVLSKSVLAQIKQSDAICFVLRDFDDPNVPGERDPIKQLEQLELELRYSDIESLESQIQKREKQGKKSVNEERFLNLLKRAYDILQEAPLYRSDMSDSELEELRSAFLLTNRPAMAVINISENSLGDKTNLASLEKSIAERISGSAISLCVKLEAEAAQLRDEDRTEFYEVYNLDDGAINKFCEAAYSLLGLATFLTTGEKETRAWTFKRGYKAPDCAGVIHSDLKRGFIRAQVVHYKDLIEAGSEKEAQAKGKVRLEGKEYTVEDGDVLEIRYNV